MGTIKTEICDVCLCPSKEDQLFDLNLSGAVNWEEKSVLTQFIAEEEMRHPFMPWISLKEMVPEGQQRHKKLAFSLEICAGCAGEMVKSIFKCQKHQGTQLDNFKKMFQNKKEEE